MSPPKMMTYAGLKRGMRVTVLDITPGVDWMGTIVDKDNATKQVQVRLDTVDRLVMADVTQVLVLDTDPLDQIHPMLAKSAKDFRGLTVPFLLGSDAWALEEKYDGERQILRWCPQRQFQATTRVVGKNTGRLGENTGKLAHIGRPQGQGLVVLDVELFHADGFQRLRSIMGSDDDKANARQAEWGYVYAIAFDCLWYAGEDLRARDFNYRRSALESALQQTPDHLRLSPIATTPAEKEALLAEVTARGGEGAMAKRWNGLYTDTGLPGRRSPDVLKIKPFSEDDVIVTGFVLGEGKYNQDKFGATQIAQFVMDDDLTPEMEKAILVPERQHRNIQALLKDSFENGGWGQLVDMGTCGGFTNEQEAEFRANPEAFIGKPIEIKYQQRWPDTGLFRHPNFLRLRHDKAPEECVYVPGGV